MTATATEIGIEGTHIDHGAHHLVGEDVRQHEIFEIGTAMVLQDPMQTDHGATPEMVHLSGHHYQSRNLVLREDVEVFVEGDADEEAGITKGTVGVRRSMTEATGTLEAALKKGVGVHRIAKGMSATGTIDFQKMSPGVILEPTETGLICSRRNLEPALRPHKNLHPTIGMSHHLRLPHLPLLLAPCPIAGIARLANFRPRVLELSPSATDRSLQARCRALPRGECQIVLLSLLARVRSNRKRSALPASSGSILT